MLSRPSQKRIWTPWRLKYVAGAKTTGCVFCEKLAADSADDRENLILYRGQRNFVIMNLYPYNNGHVMVVPNEHLATVEDLDAETLLESGRLVQSCVRALRVTMRPEGFNIGINLGKIAGAGIADHVHVHVVPRWGGDTNFMPVLGEVRLIPELPGDTYDHLVASGLGRDVGSA
ncbi:MAG: HIT domain-containing protein [Chloroflexi bacterium]|nr:HIT domain-containing protein [Chloroflexota bacterium]